MPAGRWASVNVVDAVGASADNSRYVVLDNTARAQVLIITTAGDLSREAFYLQQALVASGALHRYVASQTDGGPSTAEAYYWLGVIESRIGRSFWLSQTEPYYEAAIRLAPGEPIAKQAYANLEEFVVGGYTGSSGEHVPPDVKAWLGELERLVRTTQAEDRS